MNNQKLENLLNLALLTPEEERSKSLTLNVGYIEANNSWEIIVKYNGDLSRLEQTGIIVEELIAGYAVLTVPQLLIDSLVELEEIEYVEKPKRLYFSVAQGLIDSCITQVVFRDPKLSGQGTIVAVLDSGIDYTNPDFRNEDGSSRILTLWDQSLLPDKELGFESPKGFALGVEFTKAQIDNALSAPTKEETFRLVPSVDISGHGTAVTGIAAGNGNNSDGAYMGVAPKSNLIIVKLGVPGSRSFPRTTELMRGLFYVSQKSLEFQQPLAINLSFGNTYGAHDGNSLLERYIDNISEIGRSVICVGSGNEGASNGHLANQVKQGGPNLLVELAVSQYEAALNIQLWKNYVDSFGVIIESPGGERYTVPVKAFGKATITLERTKLLIYIGAPRPYSAAQELYFDMIPEEDFINSGIWKFLIIPEKIVTGYFYFYLPGEVVRNVGTGFYAPTPEVTLTIPSTSRKVITVGAYNSAFQSYADFSGRGYVTGRRPKGVVEEGTVKPDLVAPGVNIMAPDTRGEYALVTGTSFAAPFVTGSSALLMEWGIVQKNDLFLYGEKVKAYLRRGARQLPGYEEWPNNLLGYGALCVKDSLPE